MRALVTGGAGFIGSHLVDALLERGDEVTVVDHLERGHTDNIAGALSDGARLVRADVTDVGAMVEHVRAARAEVIYHLAAQVDVQRSVEDPSTDAHVNVGGTASVLEAARDAGAGRVILASTAAVYGDPLAIPTPEETPLAPLSPYGASKAAAESYMRLFRRLHGISTLALRMANVYGPRQDLHGESGVIAIFCGARVEGRTATIYGDGTQTRDYVFVGDVVEAFLAAGGSDREGALNVSTGVETSLLELAAKIGLDARNGAARPGEVLRSCLAPEAAADALGWRAGTSLDEGLERTFAGIGVSPSGHRDR